jgi:IclR family transcriptional regulator, acetate operon repressor
LEVNIRATERAALEGGASVVYGSASGRRKRGGAANARAGIVQSLARGLALLDSLAESPGGISLTDLCQQVGLSVSTAHRLLTTLEEHGYVRCDPASRFWSVAVQAFIVGSAFVKARNLVEIARPHMRALMEDSGETANLAVLDGVEAVFLAQVECRQMMRALAFPGIRVPLHCSAVGKALLAALPDPILAEVLRRKGLPRFTPKTITTLVALRRELDEVQRCGYAIDDQEHSVGLRCVAAVIYDENRQPAGAVSLSGPAIRIPDERIPSLGAVVCRTAEIITGAYGGNH